MPNINQGPINASRRSLENFHRGIQEIRTGRKFEPISPESKRSYVPNLLWLDNIFLLKISTDNFIHFQGYHLLLFQIHCYKYHLHSQVIL